jgi:hypothetical protein
MLEIGIHPQGTQQAAASSDGIYSLFFLCSHQPISRGTRSAGRTWVRRPVSRVLSLPRRARDGHSSGTSVTGRLARPTRAAARKCASRQPEGSERPPLFGLAPGGVYRADPVAGTAVRSYRPVSPLPAQAPAVCFLWHFPWGRPRRALPGTIFPWSPDFPPDAANGARRPSGRLTHAVPYVSGGAAVKAPALIRPGRRPR